MKWNAVLLTAILITVCPNLPAQRGGGGGHSGGGGRSGGSGGGHGIGIGGGHRLSPGFNVDRMRSDYSYRNGGGWDHRGNYNRGDYSGYGGGGWLDPDYPYYGEYWDLYRKAEADYLPEPGASVVMPIVQMPSPPPPPPPPVVATMHEYSWPDSGGDGAASYAIVTRNGEVQRASAVWVQDGQLCFLTPDGASRQLSMDEIDRPSTTRLNNEHHLKLQF